jgi:hypothetical protein
VDAGWEETINRLSNRAEHIIRELDELVVNSP